MRLTKRALMVSDSATLAINAMAARMKADGIDVVSLSAGEPDFPTPDQIAAAGIAAIRAGQTKYTDAAGLPEARRAAATALARDFGLAYDPAEIVITAGAKPAIYLALATVMETGDRVLLPAPYWVSYPDIIRLLGGEPVILPAVPDQGFVHTGAQIARAAQETGARGVVINTPNNPSGAVHTRAQVAELLAVAAEHDLWILSDEIYAQILYEGAQHVSPAHLPGGKERTLLVSGMSKTYAMTGWRIGYLAAPRDVITMAARIQSQISGNASTPSQYASIEAMDRDYGSVLRGMVAAFDGRRKIVLEEVGRIAGLSCTRPGGAFYVLIDARAVLRDRGMDDVQLAASLLQEAHLALVPGTPFGAPGFVRISYATSEPVIREGIRRLAAWVEGR